MALQGKIKCVLGNPLASRHARHRPGPIRFAAASSRRMTVERLESRMLLSAAPLGPHELFPGPKYPTGDGPCSVATGDLNGDGMQDLVTANRGDDTVSALLGNGDGTFQTQVTYAVGDYPISVAIGDFNKDGHQDLVTANYGDSTVSVLLGDVYGKFQKQVTYAVGVDPRSVAIGDFNGDGRQDLVTANQYDSTISVLMGDGGGKFNGQKTFDVGSSPFSVAIGDLDDDGHQDLVTANIGDDTVSVLLGDGDGSFLLQNSDAVGNGPHSVAIGDLDGDGHQDLVTANFHDNTVSVKLGNGDGTFQKGDTYAIGDYPESVAIGDLDGDGYQDLVTANIGDDTVSVLLNNGDGTFQDRVTYEVGDGPHSVAIGNFNGDKALDLVMPNVFDDTVSVLLGNGDGTFLSRTKWPGGSDPQSIAIGDLNGDGWQDLVTANSGTDDVSVLLGAGDGEFTPPRSYRVGDTPTSVAIGDLDGDGDQDLVTANSGDNTVSVLLGDGDGGFRPPQSYPVGPSPTSVAIGDLDNDGYQDLVTTSNGVSSVSVLFGTSNGTFLPQVTSWANTNPRSVAIGDFNGDEWQDLVVTNLFGDGVSVLLNNGDRTFEPPPGLSRVGNDPQSIAIGDFNGDGRQDLVTANSGDNTVSVLFGNGIGGLPTRVDYEVGHNPTSVAVGDFDGDGLQDLVTTNRYDYTVSVLLGNDDGTFQTQAIYLAGDAPTSVAIGDINGGGPLDLVVANYYGAVSVLLNQTNVPPAVDAGASTTIDEGDTFTRTGSFTDPDLDRWTATVNYGDGSVAQTLALNPDKTFALDHVYTDDGTFTVSVTVTDDDAGVHTDSFLVTVLNVAPIVDAGADASLDEGDTFVQTGSFTDPGLDDTWTATVDYGDGTGVHNLTPNPDKTFDLSRVYPDNGTFTVSVTVTDDDSGTNTDSFLVTVLNVAPIVDAGADATLDEGDTFTQTGSFTDPGLDSWTATVNYGDGTGVHHLTPNPDKTFDLSRVYPDNGTFTVSVTVTDDDSGTNTDSFLVTVLNVAPIVVAGADATLDEGDTFTQTGSFTDPGLDSWTATVNYGDGTAAQTLTLHPDKTFDLSHVYADNGTFTVSVTVTDDDSGTNTDTVLVTVLNVAPIVDAGADATLDEGDTFTQTGSFTDLGLDDTWTATVNYGDGTAAQTLTLHPDKTFDLSHVYADNGTFTVSVTVTDDDSGTNTDTVQVTVLNVAPIVDAGADAILDEGGTFTQTGSFTDPGLDSWIVSVNYGDGTAAQTLTLHPDKTFDLSHVYPDNGTFTVSVSVTDDDSGTNTDTVLVTVLNVAPIVDAGADATLDEGDTFTQTGSFTDPGLDDTWTATVDYGDGTGVHHLTPNPDKTFDLSRVYPDNGMFIVSVTVTDDDAGVHTDSFLVTVLNVAPIVDAGADATLDEGDTFTQTGSFTDPGLDDTWTATVDYGDGTGVHNLTPNPDKTFDLSRVYPDNGTFTVSVTVTDDDSGTNTDSFLVTVLNVAPIVVAGADATLDEGDTFVQTGSFTDPGDDSWIVSVDYGDGTGVETLALHPDKTFDLSHVYPDNGTFTVSVTVTDDDSGTHTDTLTVNVLSETSLDIDGNGAADALTDGILILRYLFDFTGDPLVNGAIALNATRSDPAEIAASLDAGLNTMLDVDANGTADALTDGILILRYLFDFTGDPLVNSAIASDATRTDPAEIAAFLDSWLPTSPPAAAMDDVYSALAYEATQATSSASESIEPSRSQLLATYDDWN